MTAYFECGQVIIVSWVIDEYPRFHHIEHLKNSYSLLSFKSKCLFFLSAFALPVAVFSSCFCLCLTSFISFTAIRTAYSLCFDVETKGKNMISKHKQHWTPSANWIDVQILFDFLFSRPNLLSMHTIIWSNQNRNPNEIRKEQKQFSTQINGFSFIGSSLSPSYFLFYVANEILNKRNKTKIETKIFVVFSFLLLFSATLSSFLSTTTSSPLSVAFSWRLTTKQTTEPSVAAQCERGRVVVREEARRPNETARVSVWR